MAATETALVVRAQRGDQGAFTELVARHHTRLIAAARALVGHGDAAEDVSQDAFVEAYRGLPRLQRPDRFGAWLFGIMRHKALNHLRSAGREVPLSWAADQADPAPAQPAADPSLDLRQRLRELPERDREILAARYLQELSYDEIAETLGVSVNTVRVRCFRAKQRLRVLLRGADEPEGCATAQEGGR